MPSNLFANDLKSIQEIEDIGYTVNGNPTVTDCRGQSCIDFDGTGDSITTLDETCGVGALSICVWIYPESVGETAGRIIDNGQSIFWVGSSNRLGFTSAGATNIFSANNATTYNAWQHVCVTRNSAGSATNFYVDGSTNGTANQNSGTPAEGTTNMIIGSRNAGDRDFNGKIQNLLIFNRVLSATEIAQLYNNTVFDYPLSEVSHWDMSEVKSQDIGWEGTGNDLDYSTNITVADIVEEDGDYGVEFSTNEGVGIQDPSGYDGLDQITVYAKCKINSHTNYQNIVNKGYDEWRLSSSGTDKKLYFSVKIDGTSRVAESTNAIDLNRIYHIVGNYDGEYGKIYINGKHEGTSPADSGSIDNNSREMGIGFDYDQAKEFLDGTVYDVKIYSTALTNLALEDLYIQQQK